MHNAWVTAAGEKMSKSLGNGALVSEVTKAYPARAVRFYLMAPHYRSAIEFSDTSLVEATASLSRIDTFVRRASEVVGTVDIVDVPDAFRTSMDDDLGTPGAVATLYRGVSEGNRALDAGDIDAVARTLASVVAMLRVLGLDADDEVWASAKGDEHLRPVVDGLVRALLDQRGEARARKDWAAADSIRDRLAELGLTITDTPGGPRWSLEGTH